MLFLKNFLKYLIPSFVFVYLTYFTWIDLGIWAISLLLIASCIICLGITKYMLGKQNSQKIEQYRILLEYLSSRLSAGYTLEACLTDAYSHLRNELGYKSALSKSLKKLNQAISSHLDLDRCLIILKNNFNCQTSDAFFDVLPYLNHYGGRLDIFVKQTYRTLNAEIQMQKDIASEQNAQKSETIILIFLPFLFSLILIKKGTGYAYALNDANWSQALLSIIFIVAHLSILCALLIMSQSPTKLKTKDIFLTMPIKPSFKKISIQISQFLLSYMPTKLGYALSENIRILTQNQPNAWQLYTQRKSIFTVIFTLITSLFAYLKIISPAFIFIIFIGTWILQDLDIIQRENKLKQQIRIEYPNFLNSMVILLRSGLSLDKSLRLMILSQESKSQSQLKSDLLKIKHDLSVGDSAAYAVMSIAENLPQEEIASILQLMARYDRDGGKELLDILEIQANSSWQLYRNAMRKRLQTKNMALFIPMTVDLFVVIIMAMLPAIASLGNINL
ncbi:MAG: type II secretion system F family protein [Clostridiaceae bacterium]|mgnify:FL=1|nr:type II secretion system F family protein [Clostridiaceae bacterium]